MQERKEVEVPYPEDFKQAIKDKDPFTKTFEDAWKVGEGEINLINYKIFILKSDSVLSLENLTMFIQKMMN